MRMSFFYAVVCSFGFACISFAADRDIQIRSVNFETSVVELHNFGASAVSMDGWRFCTQDDNETLKYSGTAGLNQKSLVPGQSFFIHFLDDAVVASNRVNRSSLAGFFAQPLDRGPYALSLYNGGSFSIGANMIDHVQWNTNGVDNATADERSDEAVSGGMWTDETKWTHTKPTSRLIELSDHSGAELHDYMDYTAVDEDALFWYRFNEGGGTNILDSSGQFNPMAVPTGFGRNWHTPWSDPVYDGDHDIANPHTFSGPLTLPGHVTDPQPSTAEWTMEAIHQFNPGGEGTVFFELDEGIGVGTTNSVLIMEWNDLFATQGVWIRTRDKDFGFNSTDEYLITPLEADGKWHHVAAVKQGKVVYGFLDYALVSSNNLSVRSDDTYEFTTNHNLSIGIALNGGSNSKTNNFFDEIRLTLRSMFPSEFLRPGQPVITELSITPGVFLMKYHAISGEVYVVEKTADLLDYSSWWPGTIFTSTTYNGSHGSGIGIFESNRNVRVRRIIE